MLALVATGSKAGICVAIPSCVFLAIFVHGWTRWWGMLLGCLTLVAIALWWPLGVSLVHRFPIWEASIKLLKLFPFSGVGISMFPAYYKIVRTENYTTGWFAHNDVLQIAIEMGIPAAIIFCSQWLAVLKETCKQSIVYAVILFAILAQSLVEFQFYVPAVSILAGLAFAGHMFNNRRNLGSKIANDGFIEFR